MKEKKTLKERVENAKKKTKVWCEENKKVVTFAAVTVVSSVISAAISGAIGERRGRSNGWQAYTDWIVDCCGENPRTIWGYDKDGKKVALDAIVTEKFYDAFKHPEKVEWYDDGSFDYVDEL